MTRALLLLHRGDVELAAAPLSEAIEPTTAATDLETLPVLLSAAADVAAARGESLRAATLWAAADHILTRLGRRETPTAARLREQWLPRARAASDPTSWEQAWTRGAALPAQQALIVAAGAVASTQLAGRSTVSH